MFEIRVLVKRLLCLDCEAKQGKLNSTFARGRKANIYDPESLVCPRCSGKNTLPEVDIDVQVKDGKPQG